MISLKLSDFDMLQGVEKSLTMERGGQLHPHD